MFKICFPTIFTTLHFLTLSNDGEKTLISKTVNPTAFTISPFGVKFKHLLVILNSHSVSGMFQINTTVLMPLLGFCQLLWVGWLEFSTHFRVFFFFTLSTSIKLQEDGVNVGRPGISRDVHPLNHNLYVCIRLSQHVEFAPLGPWPSVSFSPFVRSGALTWSVLLTHSEHLKCWEQRSV